jgi:hypothetical protein
LAEGACSCFVFFCVALTPRDSSDTLVRHISRYHEGKESFRSRALRACDHCKARKVQCSMGTPCHSCLQRELSCSYGTSAISDQPQQTLQTNSTPSQVALLTLDQEISELDKYIALYFTEFHPTWSFLHKSSFRPKRESQVLVHSVVMTGLWLSNEKGAKETAIEMHHTLMTSIQRQRVCVLPLLFARYRSYVPVVRMGYFSLRYNQRRNDLAHSHLSSHSLEHHTSLDSPETSIERGIGVSCARLRDPGRSREQQPEERHVQLSKYA